ncbi:hypothetical protein AB0J80_35485 [Actinoplanes sp. NPDC049548]|uniref:hypothetical protein n=1 Tax=Actinoplanes sp. NPDC049548 TaxID=3155152 RepID=UPI003438051A
MKTAAAIAALCGAALALTGCDAGPAPDPPDRSSPAPAPSPSVPDLTAGSRQATVRLWFLSNQDHSAVVEPTTLLTGAQYCTRFGIPSSDDVCRHDRVDTGSNVKLTLPVSEGLRRYGYGDDDFACIDEKTAEGTCPMTPAEFQVWATMNSPAPARITTKNGRIVEVAALMLV